MSEIAIFFRLLQLLTHNLHNLAKMTAFFADHEFLGDLYSKYESEYDGIIERMIGKGLPTDLKNIQIQACTKLQSLPGDFKDNGEMFILVLRLEKELCQKIEEFLASSKQSSGVSQLLGEQVNQSEIRQYKIGQRIKK